MPASLNLQATSNVAFHGSLNPALVKAIEGWGKTPPMIEGERHIVTQTRTLRYRFTPHLHPYVRELARRLIEQSVAGLQGADTDNVRNPDGTFQTLPLSFRAALPRDLALSLPKTGEPGQFEAVTLPGSVTVGLPDGIAVTLDDATTATLPGAVIATESRRGVRVTRVGGPPATTADLDLGATVTLKNAVAVTLSEATVIKGADGTLRRLTEPAAVSVPAGTLVRVVGGKPLPRLFRTIFSDAAYGPSELVSQPYPARDLDFTSSGAYSVYNWELFYHIPLAVAVHLSKSKRFEDAQRWFHFIFDPTDDSDGATPDRFWKVKPFQNSEVKQIEDILVNLSSGMDSVLKQDTINSIGAWKDSPFRPHLVARYRQTVFMFKAVMAYLDNLIDWGDELFRQDTGESINEATQVYVLAALILGDRPQAVPKKGTIAPLTYASRRGQWDELGNTLEKMESEIPFDLAPLPTGGGAEDQFAVLRSIGTSLYFCVPRNDKLMAYWDTVADRLFKIRNSLNLQGIFRQLPLFEPPIDPALLARAAAAGLDVGAVLAGINQPLPLVRFQVLIQKATEICQEVKTLGNSLLTAMEKEDSEAFSILRARHEKIILGLAEAVKYGQWQEAIKNRETLETSLTNAVQRYVFYERQLGRSESEITIPELEAIDPEDFARFKFRAEEAEIRRRPVEIDISKDLGDSGGKIVSRYEAKELELAQIARTIQDAVRNAKLVAQGLALMPDFGIDLHFWGLGGNSDIIGGTKLSDVASFMADVALTMADDLHYQSGQAARIGSYARREQDWAFQSATLAGDINSTFKQLRAAQIRESLAEREWHNHQQQIRQAEEVEAFLTNEKTGKKTNQAMYTWLKREVRGLYGQVFQFAYDVAKKAERALQHELGQPDATFLQFGYMAGKEGLLAGEKLFLDLKRMEMAYHDLNQREYELTKHISLMQVNPTALLELRTSGRCTVTLPEELFDLDGPGHYFRRIKSVAVSIPCVAGPYTSVNCTLTLTRSSIRKETGVGDGYARLGSEDSRFSDHFGGTQTIVTSNAQNDSGLFETNLRDERFLPFEGAGVISEWQLELPAGVHQFDYDTISDVLLHVRYTAREGGGLLRKEAVTHLKERLAEAQAAGSVRLFSLRHEFPTEWAKFKAASGGAPFSLTVTLRDAHFPYWTQGRTREAVALSWQAQTRDKDQLKLSAPTSIAPLPDVSGSTTGMTIQPIGSKDIEDLWLSLTFGCS